MSKRLPLRFFALLALAGLFSCTPPAEKTVDVEQVKQEIMAMEKAYQEAENANDVEGILPYYADDAHSMPPNEATRKGKDAIRKAMEANMDPENSNTIKFETIDVWAADDLAVETGAYTLTDTDGNVLDKGKYMSLFEKREGKYVSIRDIWNSDMPASSGVSEDDAMEEGE